MIALNKADIQVGMRVTYNDVNLMQMRGTVVSVGKAQHGGDCLVRWDRYGFDSVECSFNLRRDG